MTPFGEHMRKLRAERNVTLKDMASAIGVSSAYLSSLEHGRRGRPGWHLIQRILSYFNIIWDEADDVLRLARISHPKITIDTSGLSPEATELANRLSLTIDHLNDDTIAALLKRLNEDIAKQKFSSKSG